MMRKVWLAAAMAAVMTAAASTGVMAAENEKIEAGGIVFEIPAEYKDLVTVQTEDLEADTLISVSETASIEAAKALGEERDGAGWLFSISRITDDALKQLRCGDMSGMEVFAEDGDMYYVYNHPTDVCMVRETNEDMKADMEQWSELNEWGYGEMRETILADNPQLEAKAYSNTDLDVYLARAAFEDGTRYEIRSLDFGTLDPTVYGEDDYLDDLTEDVIYERIEDLPADEAPDGEYIVLAFDEGTMRFDFFPGENDQNFIRAERDMDDGETIETLYKASFEDPDKTAYGVIKEWSDSMTRTDDEGDD